MWALYRMLTCLAVPFIYVWLRFRISRGKEDALRFPERFGKASKPRPAGGLIWLHGASVGETISILPLIERLRVGFPTINLLVTSGTVTSAKLLSERLPQGVMHHYIPVDTPQAVSRFLKHWQPDIALMVESDLWPNLVQQARKRGSKLYLINARLSAQSAKRWGMFKHGFRELLQNFSGIYAQSENDAARFERFGVKAEVSGNLKYDAPPLATDDKELARMREAIGARPLWIAASTHAGEEAMVLETHKQLQRTFPDLLTVIIPRHPNRGEEIARMIVQHTLSFTRRSRGDLPSSEIYLADSLGELGLWYRLARIAFIGGSMVKHGGQNPLEPARLGCAILMGPHIHNFAAIVQKLEAGNSFLWAENAEMLARNVELLLTEPKLGEALAERAKAVAAKQSGALEFLLGKLQPALEKLNART